MKILSDTWRNSFANEQFKLVKALVSEMPEADGLGLNGRSHG